MNAATDLLPERFDLGAELVVRRWRTSDTTAMTELLIGSLDHLRPWMAWADREPLDDRARHRLFESWDRYWASGHGAVYGIFDRERPVGGCSLHRRVGPVGIDLGYWLGRTAVGRGLATKIASALSNAMLERADVEYVEISHHPSNTASARVAERLGGVPMESNEHVTRWRLRNP